jgi:hypothetical protein
MADRYTDVVILCEDLRHLNFVRRYLMCRGVESRRIRAKVAPSGRGAGSQYVIQNYPAEVKALRSRAYLRAGLVVIVDADVCSSEERLRQFAESLEQAQHDRRGESERIALLVPKRNIETWVFHLLGNDVNEDDNYERRVASSDIANAVVAFAEACPAKVAEIRVPSLKRACNELTAFLGRGA